MVEDDFLLLMELELLLAEAGAGHIVPCASVADALAAIEREGFSGAVLDWRLGRDTAAPVARRLTQLRIPFVFYTAQSGVEDFREWPHSIVVSKPALRGDIVAALVSVMDQAAAR